LGSFGQVFLLDFVKLSFCEFYCCYSVFCWAILPLALDPFENGRKKPGAKLSGEKF